MRRYTPNHRFPEQQRIVESTGLTDVHMADEKIGSGMKDDKLWIVLVDGESVTRIAGYKLVREEVGELSQLLLEGLAL